MQDANTFFLTQRSLRALELDDDVNSSCEGVGATHRLAVLPIVLSLVRQKNDCEAGAGRLQQQSGGFGNRMASARFDD